MTDAQWQIIEPLLLAPGRLAGRGGRRAKHCRREIVDAILYVVDNGIKWRALPADFPPWSTVYNHFADWERQERSSSGMPWSWCCPAASRWPRPPGIWTTLGNWVKQARIDRGQPEGTSTEERTPAGAGAGKRQPTHGA